MLVTGITSAFPHTVNDSGSYTRIIIVCIIGLHSNVS